MFSDAECSSLMCSAGGSERISIDRRGTKRVFVADALLDALAHDLAGIGIVSDRLRLYADGSIKRGATFQDWMACPRRFRKATAVFLARITLGDKDAPTAPTSARAVRATRKAWQAFKQPILAADAAVHAALYAPRPPKAPKAPNPPRPRCALDLPADDTAALRLFFEHEAHPCPERILALKRASGLSWTAFRAASLS